jgi:hypothetical protein
MSTLTSNDSKTLANLYRNSKMLTFEEWEKKFDLEDDTQCRNLQIAFYKAADDLNNLTSGECPHYKMDRNCPERRFQKKQIRLDAEKKYKQCQLTLKMENGTPFLSQSEGYKTKGYEDYKKRYDAQFNIKKTKINNNQRKLLFGNAETRKKEKNELRKIGMLNGMNASKVLPPSSMFGSMLGQRPKSPLFGIGGRRKTRRGRKHRRRSTHRKN